MLVSFPHPPTSAIFPFGPGLGWHVSKSDGTYSVMHRNFLVAHMCRFFSHGMPLNPSHQQSHDAPPYAKHSPFLLLAVS